MFGKRILIWTIFMENFIQNRQKFKLLEMASEVVEHFVFCLLNIVLCYTKITLSN